MNESSGEKQRPLPARLQCIRASGGQRSPPSTREEEAKNKNHSANQKGKPNGGISKKQVP